MNSTTGIVAYRAQGEWLASVRSVHVIRPRAVTAVVTALGLSVLLSVTTPLGAVPGNAQPPASPTPTPAPVITPETSGCPYRFTPPPPVDHSEVPAPGAPVPTAVPLPDRPVGGPRMDECGLVLPRGAAALPGGITATSWLLADAGTGDVLAAKDPHGRHRPASTIKLLTALLVADRLPVDQVVIATQGDDDQEGSSVGIGPGGVYTVGQLLTGLLLVSGNDAAHALSRQLGGVPATVEQMNELAAELGARDTRAATPSGLDGPGMSTSAYDLALLFGHVLSRPLLAEVLTTRQVDFPGFGDRPGYVVSNDNKLLAHYDGALGGKTGFTNDARHTYVGAAVRDGRPLIVVLLRGEQRPVPMWAQAAQLLDYGFALPTGQPVGQLVTEAQPTETQPIATVPATTPTITPETPPGAGSNAGSNAGSDAGSDAGQGESFGSGGLVTGLLSLGLAALVLAGLVALVVRQRRTGS